METMTLSVDYTSTPAVLSEHVLEHKGCPIHYWLGGPEDRPLLALMHGATMDHRMFNVQVGMLAAEYRVLVWDARGHGKSQRSGEALSLDLWAEDMLALLDHLGAAQAVLIGQSLGGYIAQRVYLSAPERVRAMVIIGATPLTKAYSRLDVWALKASLPLFDIWPYGHFTRTVARQTAKQPDVRAYALDAIGMISREDFLTIWKAVTLVIDTEGMPGRHIEVPLLLTHGDTDRTGSIARDMPGWAESEPKAEFVIISDASHNANQDNPHFFNTILLDFLHRRIG